MERKLIKFRCASGRLAVVLATMSGRLWPKPRRKYGHYGPADRWRKTIKRCSKKCRHCGRSLAAADSPAPAIAGPGAQDNARRSSKIASTNWLKPRWKPRKNFPSALPAWRSSTLPSMDATTEMWKTPCRILDSRRIHRRRHAAAKHARAACSTARRLSGRKNQRIAVHGFLWRLHHVARSPGAIAHRRHNIDWNNTSLMLGQDKPIISPRDPDSLAQVGFSPLTGAGICGFGSRRCAWSSASLWAKTPD